MADIFDLTMEGIDGENVELARFRDQALLIVNLASQ